MKRNLILGALGMISLGIVGLEITVGGELFATPWQQRFQTFMYDFSLAYLSALLFYVVVYYYPERSARINARQHILDHSARVQIYLERSLLYLAYLMDCHRQFVSEYNDGKIAALEHQVAYIQLDKKFERFNQHPNTPIDPVKKIISFFTEIETLIDNIQPESSHLNKEHFTLFRNITRIGIKRRLQSQLSIQQYLLEKHGTTHTPTFSELEREKFKRELQTVRGLLVDLRQLNNALSKEIFNKKLDARIPEIEIAAICAED